MCIRVAFCAIVAAAFGWGVQAAEFPSKPITMVVPFTAGGPTDTVARLISVPMTKVLKQQVLIDNAAGAGGTIGAGKVAKAAADGHTVLLWHIGMATSPALYRKLVFDPLKSFEYIGIVNDVPMTILTRKGFPAKNVKELIAYVKANKAKVTLANAGLGAASHLCGLLFQAAIETDLNTIAYKGTAPAMTDLMGGHVDLLCDQTTNTTAQIQSDKVQAYAVTSKTRVPSLPNIPTAHEAGLPGFEVSIWHGLYVPKGTPKPVVDKLTQALQEALKDPTVKAKFADLGAEPASAERAMPAALQALVKSEIDRWTPLIRKAGVYAD
jgi:tripartite-type tricarboxylate transporter receptor subunit TctC